MSELDVLRAENERLKDENKRLGRRIHNQRVMLRQNWEIVEMRRKWLGSDTARAMYCRLLKRHQALMAQVKAVTTSEKAPSILSNLLNLRADFYELW